MITQRIDLASATAIARAWAEVDDPGVTSDIDLVPIADGWSVAVVVYEGAGPFRPLGTRTATIMHTGQLRAA